MKKILITLILSNILILGCSYEKGNGSLNIMGLLYNLYKGFEPPQNVTNISGTIVDTAGTAIPNATIELSNQPKGSVVSSIKALYGDIKSSIKATSDMTNTSGEFLVAVDVGVTYTATVTDSTGANRGSFTIVAADALNATVANYTGTARVSKISATSKTTVKCEADSATVTTKSLKGRVRNSSTTAGIGGAIITTSPTTSTILSESDGTFTIAGITSDTSSIAVNVTSTGFQNKTDTVTLTCQNSSTIILLTPITTGSTLTVATSSGTSSGTGTGTVSSDSNYWGIGVWDTMVWQ